MAKKGFLKVLIRTVGIFSVVLVFRTALFVG
jgi:hypothetical protein